MAQPESQHPHLAALEAAVLAKPFLCPSGTIPVPQEDLSLFYETKDGSKVRKLDFLNASDEDIKNLVDACDPATFGLNDRDVLDETYRRAGKLDRAHFALNFDPARVGLINQARAILFEGHDDDVVIRCELYKLNVYGPGDFFKVHKDTPRDENMFASLVVVLPVVHTGGELVFSQEKDQYTFDSAAELEKAQPSSIAFVAFHSDIDHEVKTVESGYRVTLTYNIYFDPSIVSPPKTVSIAGGQAATLAAAFKTLVVDADYMPEGGFIGFGLRYHYPLSHKPDAVQQIRHRLKGCDALLGKVCDELGLTFSLWIAYTIYEGRHVLCPRRADLDRYDCEEEELEEFLCDRYDGKVIDVGYLPNTPPDLEVQWVTELKEEETAEIKEKWMYYGNEHTMKVLLLKPRPMSRRSDGA